MLGGAVIAGAAVGGMAWAVADGPHPSSDHLCGMGRKIAAKSR